MVTQKQRSSTTVAAFFLALSSVCIAPALLAEGSDGKGVFEAQKCNLCHAVSSAGIEAKTKSEKLKGPDLVNLAKDFEATIASAETWLYIASVQLIVRRLATS